MAFDATAGARKRPRRKCLLLLLASALMCCAGGAAGSTEGDAASCDGTELYQESLQVHRPQSARHGMSTDGLLLLAHGRHASRTFLNIHDMAPNKDGSVCLPLTNQGTHFTVDVQVGTPPQNFSIIADTGSNTLIIQSCACQVTGHCQVEERGHCFIGTNTSTSFSLLTSSGAVKPQQGKELEPLAMKLGFGSGTIVGILAKDVVRIGGRSAMMEEGFLLMVDEALNIAGPTLEGILGLGLPSQNGSLTISADKQAQTSSEQANIPKATGFLEQANIGRFSMCFDREADGVLRLNTGKASKPLGSIGQLHWGLGLEGISVAGDGASASPLAVELCQPESLQPEQETPCGAIPDSGTTMITGPKAHFVIIQAALCDAWPRCSSTASKEVIPAQPGIDKATAELIMKSGVFESLVQDCSSWANSTEKGFAELPTLQFHLTGKGGGKQTISLPGNVYTIQYEQELTKIEYMHVPIFGRIPVRRVPTGETKTVCVPTFQSMEYNTEKNGPVFILGLPLFYQYTVNYDLGTEPPEMGLEPLEDEPCRPCSSERQGLGLAEADLRRQRRWPRHVASPYSRTSIDVSQPM